FTVFALFYLSLNIELEKSRLGFAPQEILDQLNGNPDLFLPAKDLSSLVSEMHVNLFIYPLLIVTLTSIFIHIPLSSAHRMLWIMIPSTAILFDSLGLLGAKYLASEFVWIKIISFWTFEITAIVMCFTTIKYLLSKAPTSPVTRFHNLKSN
ncbi:MAG: hypothetical protein KDD35_11980, partial [Bdellovibrionales bacterium]|nr:hypothetical protein [Bdellovibrionales bacterium]